MLVRIVALTVPLALALAYLKAPRLQGALAWVLALGVAGAGFGAFFNPPARWLIAETLCGPGTLTFWARPGGRSQLACSHADGTVDPLGFWAYLISFDLHAVLAAGLVGAVVVLRRRQRASDRRER